MRLSPINLADIPQNQEVRSRADLRWNVAGGKPELRGLKLGLQLPWRSRNVMEYGIVLSSQCLYNVAIPSTGTNSRRKVFLSSSRLLSTC